MFQAFFRVDITQMSLGNRYAALGLMSGTSMDGVDVALLETDGLQYSKIVNEGAVYAYPELLRKKLSAFVKHSALQTFYEILHLERALTHFHIDVVHDFLKQMALKNTDVDLIGFHGQTILHAPNDGLTWQMGDAVMLAEEVGIDVVFDFRKHDMKHGGYGAPIVPVYHQLVSKNFGKRVCVLNMGGVASATYVKEGDLFATDVVVCNAMLDDWARGQPYGSYDKLAKRGRVSQVALKAMIATQETHSCLQRALDRNQYCFKALQSLTLEDGMATLFEFIAGELTHRLLQIVQDQVDVILLCGGGRKHRFLVHTIQKKIPHILVQDIDEMGYNGDTLEAQAFAYLAVRSLCKLPITFPTTTTVERPTTGGVLYRSLSRHL